MEEFIVSYLENKFGADRDPYRQNTAIGDIRQLKLSDKIILRVETPYPLKLREASYNVYFNKNWLAKNTEFNRIVSAKEVWRFTNIPLKSIREVLIAAESSQNHIKRDLFTKS